MPRSHRQEDDRLSFSEEEADCKYIVNLLLCCGEAVRLGYMRPFVILHSDINLVKANIQGSPNKRDMLLSYTRYIEHSRHIQLFYGD